MFSMEGRWCSIIPPILGIWLIVGVSVVTGQVAPTLSQPSVQIGQLLMTPIAAGQVAPSVVWGLTKPPKSGKHYVIVTVNVKNNSIYPNCTDLSDLHLLTDANHKYGQLIWHAPDSPATERLPSQAASVGSFAFQVRDGEKERALIVERSFVLERGCWGQYSFSPTEPFSASVYVPLVNLPMPSVGLKEKESREKPTR